MSDNEVSDTRNGPGSEMAVHQGRDLAHMDLDSGADMEKTIGLSSRDDDITLPSVVTSGLKSGQEPIDLGKRVSFRDVAMRSAESNKEDNFLKSLEVELANDDIIISRDGPVLEIRFSDRVHKQIDAKLAKAMIVRLLGRSIGLRALKNRIQALWNPMGDFSIIDLDNDYYLIKFSLDTDYDKVISGGPWMIYGSYLTVQPWSREFSTAEDHPKQILAWVRLPGLPYRYYSKHLFNAIAGLVGEVIRVDFNTMEGRRGRFARLAVMVRLDQPLLPGMIIDGRFQRIEYEGLPLICFGCGKYGHTKELCAEVQKQEAQPKIVEPTPKAAEMYGPWM